MGDLIGRRVGDYTLREKVGDGGYGDVYRAEHWVLKRTAIPTTCGQVGGLRPCRGVRGSLCPARTGGAGDRKTSYAYIEFSKLV